MVGVVSSSRSSGKSRGRISLDRPTTTVATTIVGLVVVVLVVIAVVVVVVCDDGR